MARFNQAGWLDVAVRVPGPAIKTSGFRRETSGTVYHSAVGNEGGMMAVLRDVRPPIGRRVSWALSNMKDGRILQHYPIDIVTWASNQRNPDTAAMEHEGGGEPPSNYSEPLTGAQVRNGIVVADALKARYRWGPYSRTGAGQNLIEHNEIVATACPSRRIEPIWKILTKPRPAPPDDEEDDMSILVILNTNETPGTYYLSTWMSKRWLSNMDELNWYRALGVPEARIAQARLDEINDEYSA